MSQNKATEYPIWDYAKLVFAFLVVGIHTHACTGNESADFFLSSWLGRIAVPMFFCIAGYFLFLKAPDGEIVPPGKTLWRYISRIFLMYAIWTVFYLIVMIVIPGVTCPQTVREWLIWLEYATVRGDSYTHLWYLSSLFTAVFLIWLFTRFISLRATFVVALALYFFGLLWLPHFYLVKDVVENNSLLTAGYTMLNRYLGWPRNGTFFGFVFVAMGALFAKEKPRRLPAAANWLLFILFFGLSFAEVWWIREISGLGNAAYCALQLSLLPSVYFLFHALQQVKMEPRPIGKKLRLCSTDIYLLHPFFMILLYHLARRIPPLQTAFNAPFVFWCTTYIVSFAISCLLVRAEASPRGKFLKRLH